MSDNVTKMSDMLDKNKKLKPKKNGVTLKPAPNLDDWKHRPNETDKAYEAFELYCNLRYEKKGGIREVSKQLGKSESLIGRWSAKHEWKERYLAYESYQKLVEDQEQRKALREEAKNWAKKRSLIRQEGFGAGLDLLKRAKQLLALPVYEKEVREQVTAKSGEVIETVTIINFKEHPKDARLYLETGLKLMRQSADMSTENIQISESSEIDFDSMTVEELEALADQFAAVRKKETEIGENL